MKTLILSVTALLAIAPLASAEVGPGGAPEVLVQPGRSLFFGMPGPEGLSNIPNVMTEKRSTLCTGAFMFSGASKVYIVSAAHCAQEQLDTADHEPIYLDEGHHEMVWPRPQGIPVYARYTAAGIPIDTTRVGTVVYAIRNTSEGGFDPNNPTDIEVKKPDPNLPMQADVSLIELDKDVSYNPAMCAFGGPVVLGVGPIEPQLGYMFGQSRSMGQVDRSGYSILPARMGLVRSGGLTDATGTPEDDESAEHYMMPTQRPPATRGGDSGAPVMTATGLALGPQMNVDTPRYKERLAQSGIISLLSAVIPRAEAALGVDLELMTAPLRSTPDLQDCR